MTKALIPGTSLYWYGGKLRLAFKPTWFWRIFWYWQTHRIGYCEYPPCGMWCLNRRQVINRSTASAWLCEECAAEEQKEVDAAWAEYHSGCL